MFLTKYNPARNIDSIFDSELFPGLIKWFDKDVEDNIDAFRLPKTNVEILDDQYVVTLEMPGVDKKDISVAVENDSLVITGGRKEDEKVEKKGMLRREIRSSNFRRSFTLDNTIDRENIKAKLENGVLTVTLLKKAETVGKKIDVD